MLIGWGLILWGGRGLGGLFRGKLSNGAMF